jgi:DNA-binding CsgD family transcriptional regulator
MPRSRQHFEPAVGQTWTAIGVIGGGRFEYTIDEIKLDEAGQLRAYGHTASGRQALAISVDTMRKGLRGCRMLRHADGTEVVPLPARATATPTERSRLGREYRPRGTIKMRPITLEETQVVQLRAKGLTRRAVAEELGLGESAVVRMEQNVREIREMMRLREEGV